MGASTPSCVPSWPGPLYDLLLISRCPDIHHDDGHGLGLALNGDHRGNRDCDGGGGGGGGGGDGGDGGDGGMVGMVGMVMVMFDADKDR